MLLSLKTTSPQIFISLGQSLCIAEVKTFSVHFSCMTATPSHSCICAETETSRY